MMGGVRPAITAGDATAAGNLLQPTMSAIDQAIAKNVLHENTANRYKSRLPLAFNGVKAKAAAKYSVFSRFSIFSVSVGRRGERQFLFSSCEPRCPHRLRLLAYPTPCLHTDP